MKTRKKKKKNDRPEEHLIKDLDRNRWVIHKSSILQL